MKKITNITIEEGERKKDENRVKIRLSISILSCCAFGNIRESAIEESAADPKKWQSSLLSARIGAIVGQLSTISHIAVPFYTVTMIFGH